MYNSYNIINNTNSIIINNGNNNNITISFKNIVKNKILIKYILNLVKELNKYYLWNTNSIALQKTNRFFISYSIVSTYNSPSFYHRKNYRIIDEAEWILKNNYIGLLIDKLRIVYERYHVEHKMVWSTESFSLLAQKVRDEATLELVVETLTEYQMALLECSVQHNNLILFSKVCIKSSKRLIKDYKIMVKLFLEAIESGSYDIVQFIIQKYSPAIAETESVFERAVNSKSIEMIKLILKSTYYNDRHNVEFSKILNLNDLELVQHFSPSVPDKEFQMYIEAYENSCVTLGLCKFSWQHVDILKFVYPRLIKNSRKTLGDIKMSEILYNLEILEINDKFGNPFDLESDRQLAYFTFAKLLHMTGSKNFNLNLFSQLVSMNNHKLLEYLADRTDFFPVNIRQHLFRFIVEFGDINTVKKFAKYQQTISMIVYAISKVDTLDILQFLRERSIAPVALNASVMAQPIRSGNTEVVLYMLDQFGLNPNDNYTYDAFSNGHIDLTIALAKRNGLPNLSRSKEYYLAIHYLRLCREFGKESVQVTQGLLWTMIALRLKTEFEMALKHYPSTSDPIDPLVFLLNNDLEWMYEAIQMKHCAKYTKYDDYHGEILQLNLGRYGSPQFYYAYASIVESKNTQWKKKIYDEAQRYSRTKLLKIIKDIDE